MPPKKASSEQYKHLIDLIEKSDCIRWGKGTPEVKKNAWENIALQLNALGGVEKNGEGWKKAFTELKSHIKSKIRGEKNLNDTETKCAEIMGIFASCSGMAQVPELGLTVQNEIYQVDEKGFLVVEEPELPIVESDSEVEKNEQRVEVAQSAQSVADKIEETDKGKRPKQIFKKKSTKSTQSLLGEHINTTNKEEAFQQLCHQLNGEKNAPERSTANWKRIFSDWETKVKAKARRIHFEQELTGGGIPIIEILTNLEKKLLEILSKILIYGHPDIIELCFKRKNKFKKCTYKTKSRKTGIKYKTRLGESFELNPILLREFERILNCIKISLCILNDALENLMGALHIKQ
ncbi:unnamed protein product [Ceutorhynchus assimilis]|uniref:Regulatory protein zeste n=1 Tax=Ceutorhynchus assimilis TaxID=467358 RepID=A0A9N9MQW4_9CUCU|nr:unnamed protein product [Ceutorhynchus assimilis]